MKPQHYHHAMPAPDACIDQCDGQYMKLIALAQCSCAVGVGGGSATRPNSQYKKIIFYPFFDPFYHQEHGYQCLLIDFTRMWWKAFSVHICCPPTKTSVLCPLLQTYLLTSGLRR